MVSALRHLLICAAFLLSGCEAPPAPRQVPASPHREALLQIGRALREYAFAHDGKFPDATFDGWICPTASGPQAPSANAAFRTLFSSGALSATQEIIFAASSCCAWRRPDGDIGGTDPPYANALAPGELAFGYFAGLTLSDAPSAPLAWSANYALPVFDPDQGWILSPGAVCHDVPLTCYILRIDGSVDVIAPRPHGIALGGLSTPHAQPLRPEPAIPPAMALPTTRRDADPALASRLAAIAQAAQRPDQLSQAAFHIPACANGGDELRRIFRLPAWSELNRLQFAASFLEPADLTNFPAVHTFDQKIFLPAAAALEAPEIQPRPWSPADRADSTRPHQDLVRLTFALILRGTHEALHRDWEAAVRIWHPIERLDPLLRDTATPSNLRLQADIHAQWHALISAASRSCPLTAQDARLLLDALARLPAPRLRAETFFNHERARILLRFEHARTGTSPPPLQDLNTRQLRALEQFDAFCNLATLPASQALPAIQSLSSVPLTPGDADRHAHWDRLRQTVADWGAIEARSALMRAALELALDPSFTPAPCPATGEAMKISRAKSRLVARLASQPEDQALELYVAF